MTVQLVRLINNQQINRSILIDKIDKSQGNFSGYAQRAKQKIYVPYANPVDPSVKGYIDLAPTDEVLLAEEPKGVIAGLIAPTVKYPTPLLIKALVPSTSVAASTIISVVDGGVTTTITGTVFVSISPDKTYLIITNLAGVSRRYATPTITVVGATSITIPDASIVGGPLASGWKVQVLANSKYSNIITIP